MSPEQSLSGQENESVTDYDRAATLYYDCVEADSLTTSDATYNFAQALINKYGDGECRKHLVFHALIGSTPAGVREYYSQDFEGEDSVVDFLENLKRTLSNNQPDDERK
jgi:hypothetical protein